MLRRKFCFIVMPWLSDLSRHFKLYCSNLIFSPLVGANIAYVLNARGILALPSFGKRVSSFTLLWQHSSSATTTTQPFIQFPREVIVNSISRGSKANWDLHDGGNCLLLASNYLKPRLVMRWQKLKKNILLRISMCLHMCWLCSTELLLRRDLKCATSHCAHFFLLFWAV